MVDENDLQFLRSYLSGVVLYALGPCGAGKGTQIPRLREMLPEIKFRHLSPGEEFRRLQQQGGSLAAEVKNFTDSGQLVPFEMLQREVIHPFIDSLASDEVAVIDGCPREESQASVSSLFNRSRQLAVIFEASDEACLERLSHGKRGRSDDDFATIERRLKIYRGNLPGVRRGLSKHRVPCIIIDGTPVPEKTTKEFIRSLTLGLQAVCNSRSYHSDYQLPVAM